MALVNGAVARYGMFSGDARQVADAIAQHSHEEFEEAHRFALKASSGAKTKSLTHSTLEKIEGIGSAKAKKLLSAMPLGKIRKASIEELSAIAGISERDAKNIVEYYLKKGVK